MPMQPESLEVLEKASGELATKQDALALRQDFGALRENFSALREDFGVLKKSVAALEENFTALRCEFDGLRQAFDLLRKDSEVAEAKLRGEMKELGGALREQIERSVGGVARQMYTAILGQMAVLLGFTYFFATHLR
jgi:predicted nuclease with TOPRIM domain